MSYKTKADVLKRVQEHNDIAEKLGYEVVGTFLQGSFNYGEDMSDAESDVDTKCIVLPSFEDICLNRKAVSHTHVLENNEHLDIKDIRVYMQMFKKQNINFVEILFSDYVVMNPKYEDMFNILIENREKIARYDEKAALNTMCGMAYEKYKALTHPYPATLEKIEKYGFDGKQLSHILRIYEFEQRYINNEKYADCLKTKNAKQLLELKRNRGITLEEAKAQAKYYSDATKFFKDKYLDDYFLTKDKEVETILEEVSVSCIKDYLKRQLQD